MKIEIDFELKEHQSVFFGFFVKNFLIIFGFFTGVGLWLAVLVTLVVYDYFFLGVIYCAATMATLIATMVSIDQYRYWKMNK